MRHTSKANGRIRALTVGLVAVLMVAWAGVAASAQQNLVVNSSFENGLDGWGLIYQDRVGTSGHLDETVGHTGKASFRTESENPAEVTGLRQDLHNIEPGTYRISVAFKSQGFVHGGRALSSAVARIQFKESGGASLGPNLHLMLDHDTRGEWEILETEFYVSEETDFLLLELMSYYIMGTVWWDDIQVVRIGD